MAMRSGLISARRWLPDSDGDGRRGELEVGTASPWLRSRSRRSSTANYFAAITRRASSAKLSFVSSGSPTQGSLYERGAIHTDGAANEP